MVHIPRYIILCIITARWNFTLYDYYTSIMYASHIPNVTVVWSYVGNRIVGPLLLQTAS